MVKLGDYEYDLVQFETEKEDIKKLILESHNPKVESILKKIDVLTLFRFDDKLPSSLEDQAQKAFVYALDKGFETFTDIYDQFIFGKPKLKMCIEVSPEYLKVETNGKEFYTPRDVSGASFEGLYSTHEDTEKDFFELEEEELQKKSPYSKDKTIVLLKKTKINEDRFSFRLFNLDKSLKIKALMEPFKDKDRVEEEVLYQIMNGTSQYLSMPFILSNIFKDETSEGVDLNSYSYLQLMTSLALGTTLLTNYYNSLGLTHKFKPTDFASKEYPYVLKAEQLYFDSKGSLEKCFELVKEEINLTLETLKRD